MLTFLLSSIHSLRLIWSKVLLLTASMKYKYVMMFISMFSIILLRVLPMNWHSVLLMLLILVVSTHSSQLMLSRFVMLSTSVDVNVCGEPFCGSRCP